MSTDLPWKAVLSVLVIATLFNVAWTFRESLAGSPALHSLMARLGWLEEPSPPEAHLAGDIQLLSRDLQVHPDRTGILVLRATFVNRSNLARPWPQLDLQLLDAASHPLAVRRFGPDEYLGAETARPELLAPGVHVPILLEFADPGAVATGFELQFH